MPLAEEWLLGYGLALRAAGRPCRLGVWVWPPEQWDPLHGGAPCWAAGRGQLLLYEGEVPQRAQTAGLEGRQPRRQLLFAGVRAVEHMCAPGERRFMGWAEARRAWPRLW